MSILRHTSYTNAVLSGVTTEGLPLCIIAGKHAPGFPFDTPESDWDEVLFLVGDVAGSVVTANLETLTFELDTTNAGGPARMRFDGEVSDKNGNPLSIGFELPLSLRAEGGYPLAKPFGIQRPWLPGMDWRPFFALGDPTCAKLTVGGKQHGIRAFSGQLERATVDAFNGARLAFVYDYLAVSPADADAPYSYVGFTSRALCPEGFVGWVLGAYLKSTASLELTLFETSTNAGNRQSVPVPTQAERNVIVHFHEVDLGYAMLERQIIRLDDGAGRPLLGLRENFRRTV